MTSRQLRQYLSPRAAPAWPGPDRAVTDRELVAELRRRQYMALLEHSPDAIVIVDAVGRICEWNPAAEALLGLPRDTVIDAGVSDLIPVGRRGEFDRAWAELVGGRPGLPPSTHDLGHGETRGPVRVLTASIQAGGGFAGAVAILRTAPEEGRSPGPAPGARPLPARAVPAQPSWSASRDELTGLPAKEDLQERLTEQVPDGWYRGVAALDLDALASVNEAYGPDVFDEVLQDLARRLASVPTAAYLGRWQPEVFVWVVDTQDATTDLTDLSRSVMTSLHEPFQVGADRLRFTPSMGIATSATVPVAGLLPAAMGALRAAKDAGRDRVAWYSNGAPSGPTGALRLDADLHDGIANDELRLHYQPIVELADDAVVGVEALVRWERPGVGLLRPASFIEVAERTGQIIPLGAWVARAACRAAVELRPADGGPFSVSINVSGRQLGDPGLVAMLDAALRDSGCPPEDLVVEITETALMDDLSVAVATLEEIKAMGVKLDLDDFGTGYSSLVYLKHFPVDRIKIDQSFVAGLGADHADTVIVASTIALAHAVGIRAVAEGVETSEQLELLSQMGCDYAQGYLLGHPLDAEALARWLAERRAGIGPRAQAAARDTGGPLGDAIGTGSPATGDPRQGRADQRDAVADERDGAADLRDAVADLRDQMADVHEGDTAAGDTAADHRDDAVPDPGTGATEGGEHHPGIGRPEATDRRQQAADLRKDGADDRDRARQRRDVAAHDRDEVAARRVPPEREREDAVDDEPDQGPAPHLT